MSQRVDDFPNYGEQRDSLDQRWTRFCIECGFLPVPVPNNVQCVPQLWEAVRPTGVVLTGGNDLVAVGGDAPERDAAEDALLKTADKKSVPVIGICRGLQFLAQRGGATLQTIEGHVAARHGLTGAVNRTVNSFHSWAIGQLGPEWEVLARAEDGCIEFARCLARKQWGIMWHPEREESFCSEDIKLFRTILTR